MNAQKIIDLLPDIQPADDAVVELLAEEILTKHLAAFEELAK